MSRDTKNFILFVIIAFITLVLTSCSADDTIVIETCKSELSLDTVIVGEPLENRGPEVEDIYFRNNTLRVQVTYTEANDQYRVVVYNMKDTTTQIGYEWWYGYTTPKGWYRTYELPTTWPDCLDTAVVKFGFKHRDSTDYTLLGEFIISN